MNKDEILEKSRKENKAQDERERLTLAQAGRIATAVGGCVCAVIILLDAVLSDAPSFAAWAVYLSMTGTTLLVKFIKLRKKHELIFGVLQLALAAAFLAMHIARTIGR